jgi:hypothetical protein
MHATKLLATMNLLTSLDIYTCTILDMVNQGQPAVAYKLLTETFQLESTAILTFAKT